MIAASTARASNEPAPKVSQFRISRYHGAERARCAVPRLSPPGRGLQSGPSPSAFRRPVTTRAAARTCRHAAFFRLVRAGVGAALVALAALAFALPAAAQSPTTFVGNTGQPANGESHTEQDRAQRFTTGSHANGYDLSSVRLMFGRGYFFLSVSVCTTDANGFPTSSCTPLTFKWNRSNPLLEPRPLQRAGEYRPPPEHDLQRAGQGGQLCPTPPDPVERQRCGRLGGVEHRGQF